MTRSAKVNQVILIILDDVRAEHLFNWMRKGKLPHIAELAKNGITSENCITSFPSVTMPCYSNIITGAYSGYYPKEGSGVPNYHWMNRTDPPSERRKPPFIRNYSDRSDLLKINKDIGSNVKTIFEQAPEGNMLSSTCFLYRGAYFALARNFFDVEPIFKNVEDAFKNPGKIFSNREVPLISVAYVPHTDDLMHNKGFDHPVYINAIIECDKYLGSLMDTLKKTGYYDSTAISIISDHGNFKAEKNINLEPFFQQKGLIPYIPDKGIGDFDCNFGSVGFFNFRGDTWHHHPTVAQMKTYKTSGVKRNQLNLFETLWEIPRVKLMYYKDEDNTPDKGIIYLERYNDAIGKKLKGKIEYEGEGRTQKTKYTFESKELFGYEKHEDARVLLDNKGHTIDEWLAATSQIDFTILVDQLPRFFKNPRACDIMVSTIGDYAFNYEHGRTMGNSLYNHDVALRKSMTVPFIIGGSPEIPKLHLSYCKTTDIVPTLLDLLGLAHDSSVVGKSIFKYQ